ncbi:hypothetical protein AKJ18_00400 [Vibrio xuii]|nr:hypothetical protein AKJ18_00400 [Vibrio xuii]
MGFLIAFPNGRVFWAATKFLGSRKRTSHNEQSTRYNNALYLVRFFDYLTRLGVVGKSNTNEYFEQVVFSVDNAKLNEYWLHLSKRQCLQVASANAHLAAIVDFYWWLQNNWDTGEKYLCGWADIEKGIPVHRIQVLKGVKDNSYKNPFRKNTPKRATARYVPTRQQVSDLADLIQLNACETYSEVHFKKYKDKPAEIIDMGFEYSTRDLLVLDWITQAGLRLNEARHLRCSTIQMAQEDVENEVNSILRELAALEIESYTESIPPRMISVVISDGTKKGKTRTVQVSPELIERTLNFIKFERKKILEKGHCKDTGELFVSVIKKKKGSSARMSNTRLADIVTFDLTGGERSKKEIRRLSGRDAITPHTLRRYAITNYAVLLIRADQIKKEGLTQKVTDIDWQMLLNNLRSFAGHEDESTTLQYYLDIAKVIAYRDPESNRADIEAQRTLIAMLESQVD